MAIPGKLGRVGALIAVVVSIEEKKCMGVSCVFGIWETEEYSKFIAGYIFRTFT